MRIAPVILCSLVVCLVYAQTAYSFHLGKEPLFAAKAQFANDVKVKIAAAANHAYLFKKKAAVAIVTPIIAIKDWKKALLAKKLAKIAGPIIALRNLKKAIIEKKLNTLGSIIPTAAGFGLGGLSQTPEGYAFTEWNGTPLQLNDPNSFVLVPEEYTNYHVEDSAAARTVGQSGDFIRSTLNGAQTTLENIGSHVPFLSTLTNGVSSFKQSFQHQPIYKFVPNLGFHQYSNIHYEPSVPVSIPTAPEEPAVVFNKYESLPHENYGLPAPYPPTVPELPVLPEVPHPEYGVPSTTVNPPAEEYGPPPTYGVPPKPTFKIPSTSYGVPLGSSYSYTQKF